MVRNGNGSTGLPVATGLVGRASGPVGYTGSGSTEVRGQPTVHLNGQIAAVLTRSSHGGRSAGNPAATVTTAKRLAGAMIKHYAPLRAYLGGTVVFRGRGDLYEAYQRMVGQFRDCPSRDLQVRLREILDLRGDACIAAMDGLVLELEPLQGTVPIYQLPQDNPGATASVDTGQRQATIESILTAPRAKDEDLCAQVIMALRDEVLPLAAAWAALKKGLVILPE